MHRDPGHFHLAHFTEHRADVFGGRTATAPAITTTSGAYPKLTLDDVAQFLRVGVDDADPVHLGALHPGPQPPAHRS